MLCKQTLRKVTRIPWNTPYHPTEHHQAKINLNSQVISSFQLNRWSDYFESHAHIDLIQYSRTHVRVKFVCFACVCVCVLRENGHVNVLVTGDYN